MNINIKFRGFRVDGGGWAYGFVSMSKNLPCEISGKITFTDCYFINEPSGKVHHVEKDSVGLHWQNGFYEGDIFYIKNTYPFTDKGNTNYLGVIEYVPEDGYCGWFYDLHCTNPKLRGCACGGGLADVEGLELTVIGNIYENIDKLKTFE